MFCAEFVVNSANGHIHTLQCFSQLSPCIQQHQPGSGPALVARLPLRLAGLTVLVNDYHAAFTAACPAACAGRWGAVRRQRLQSRSVLVIPTNVWTFEMCCPRISLTSVTLSEDKGYISLFPHTSQWGNPL